MSSKVRDSEFIEVASLRNDVGRRGAQGAVSAAVGQLTNTCLRLASVVVLARLLSPEDFGLYGMVMLVVGVLYMLSSLGLPAATIQRETIDPAQVNALFWLSTASGIVIMGLTMALAPVAAWFYDEPRVSPMMLVVSVLFVFAGASSQHMALLRRRLRMVTTAVIDVLGIVMGVIFAIAAAWMGAGYWALVIQVVVQHTLQAIFAWVSCRWRPSWPPKLSGTRELVAFGLNLSGFHVLSTLTNRLDNALIGLWWGAAPLGFYTRAYVLFMAPMNRATAPLTTVLVPMLSRLQDDPARYRRTFAHALRLLSWALGAVAVIAFWAAPEIVQLTLGSGWERSAKMLRFFSVGVLAAPFLRSFEWVFVSLGKTGVMFRWGVAKSLVTAAGLVVGTLFGPEGTALGFSIAALITAAFSLPLVVKRSPLRALHILAGAATPLIGLSAASGLWILFEHYVELPAGLTRLFCITLVVAVTSAATFVVSGDLALLKRIITLVRSRPQPSLASARAGAES